MRAVIQRVSKAKVTVEGKVSGQIEDGVMILLGVESADTVEDGQWLARKICQLRIFGDDTGKMNLSLVDCGGEALVVSQFTLHARVKKGTRPSFERSAPPDTAIPLYEAFIKAMETNLGKAAQTGQFGAMMEVSLVNDGPVTIVIDTKNRE